MDIGRTQSTKKPLGFKSLLKINSNKEEKKMLILRLPQKGHGK